MNKCKDQGSKVGKKESNSPYGSFYPSTLIACTLNMAENRDEFVNNEELPPPPPPENSVIVIKVLLAKIRLTQE